MLAANKRQDSENTAPLLCQKQTQRAPSSAFLPTESEGSDPVSPTHSCQENGDESGILPKHF